MLLRLSCPAADWTRLAAALDAAHSPALAGVVRAMLAAAPPSRGAAPVPLAFTPQQAGALQRTAARLGLNLPATPIPAEPYPADRVTAPAERAEAVAAAEAIVRHHQRRQASHVLGCRPFQRESAPHDAS